MSIEEAAGIAGWAESAIEGCGISAAHRALGSMRRNIAGDFGDSGPVSEVTRAIGATVLLQAVCTHVLQYHLHATAGVNIDMYAELSRGMTKMIDGACKEAQR